jgi:hypothetical protein
MPVEARRERWGWFGSPYGYVSYDDDGRLLIELRKPVPVGERCLYCGELFGEGDSGQAMPCVTAGGIMEIRHIHKECQLRSVMGPVAHLEGRCSCHGGGDHDAPGRTVRQESLAVWAWVQAHGYSGGAG